MDKIKFKHFETDSGKISKSIQINLGSLNLNEWLDDVEVEMTIKNDDIHFNILNKHYYDKGELKDLQYELKRINWDGGYEFFDLLDIQTNETYFIIADRNSDMFNKINSPQNIKNLNQITKKLKGIK